MNTLYRIDESGGKAGVSRSLPRAVIVLVALMMLLFAVSAAFAATPNKPSPEPVFISPANGETVSDFFTVMAYSPFGSDRYTGAFRVDEGEWQPMHHTGNGIYTGKWGTFEVANGKHTLTARFTGWGGCPEGSCPEYLVSVSVNVMNEVPDG